MVSRSGEISHLADIRSLHIAKDDAGAVIRHHAVEVLRRVGAGEVEYRSPSLQTGPGGRELIGFHGKKKSLRGEFPEDREESAGLALGVNAGGVGERGFGPEINQMGSFRP